LSNKSALSKVMVSIKENIYLYKYCTSLDGNTWVNSHQILKVEPLFGIDASGGKVDVKRNLAV